MENTKFIWSDKKMTRKIVGEDIKAIHNIFNSPQGRAEVQNCEFLVYIDPVGRDGGRNITARITVYAVVPEAEVQAQTNQNYYREWFGYPQTVYGEVHPQVKSISFNMPGTLKLRDPNFEKAHRALKAFEIAVAKFLEVFKDYIPEP
jgi:hypothetical protein